MKRPLPYSYHFNFGTSRTQEHIKPRLITSYMDGAHNLPPNKRTCSRKEINALQADEDIIPHSDPTNKQPHNAPIRQEDHTGENNTFQSDEQHKHHIKTPFALYGRATTRKGYYLPYIAL